jgi:hypothetical protein
MKQVNQHNNNGKQHKRFIKVLTGKLIYAAPQTAC